jgi:hypothetical protein
MNKFIITEEDRKHIKGLYEQVQQKSGCTGNPNSINVLNINVYIDKSLFVGDDGYWESQLFESLEDYSNSNPFKVAIEFSKNVPLNNTQRLFQFQVDATYQNSLKQTGWIDKYFKGFTEQLNYIIQYTNLDPKYFKLTGPNLNWGGYFESEPTSCPDLCSGAGYKIEYKPPTN